MRSWLAALLHAAVVRRSRRQPPPARRLPRRPSRRCKRCAVRCCFLCSPAVALLFCPADKREEYDEPDFALIDTLFSLAEAHLFMQARGRPGAGWAGVRGLLAPAPRGLGCPWRATPVCPSLTAAIAASNT